MTPDPSSAAEAPVLLYDGLCGLCDGTVQFVLRHDRRDVLRFATLQGDYASEVRARHPELADVDSLVLVEPASGPRAERVRVRSDAALAVGREMGGAWRLAGLLRVVPAFLRDAVYDGVARNRLRWFGRRHACRVPEPGVRPRFLD